MHVFHDERSASFAALGYGLVTGRPAVVLCSSGTAGTHFHAAVVEADLSSVPMLVVTADRPPELHDVGAAQTIDQTHLFGRSVRWFHDPGPPSAEAARSWRSLARRSRQATVGVRPGPVHLNLAFREPLVGAPGPLPTGLPQPAPVVAFADSPLDTLVPALDRQRGVIVAGRGAASAADAIATLSATTGWPILADARSGCRHLPTAVATADSLLRHERFSTDHAPEVVLHIGEPWASRVVNEWLAASGAHHVHLSPVPRPLDPALVVDRWVTAPIGRTCAWLATQLRGATGTTWAARWQHAEAKARGAMAAMLETREGLDEPTVARIVVRALGGLGDVGATGSEIQAQLVVSSSMPIRDVEWFTEPAAILAVISNRGANGIDGVVATAIGAAVAAPGVVTGVLIGDVAFLHDSSSLTALARRGLDVRIVVVDNDGGGIFSFLPQAGAVAPELFELLYGTPHGTDLLALAAAHGLTVHQAGSRTELEAALTEPGPSVTVVRTDRAANVLVHDAIHRAVREALG